MSQEVKEGIKIHYIKTDKFKTDLIAIFLSMPIKRETVTIDSLVPAVLRRGTSNLKTQEEISKKLERMYGAEFDCGIEKVGDNHVIKLYIESISDKFIPQNEDILGNLINTLIEILLNPLIENNGFKQEYVESEKKNLEQLINAKIDNKDQYSQDRTVEIMYENEPYGLYKYGYIEDLKNINTKTLYNRYQEIIQKAKIDIYISGDFEENKVKDIIEKNKDLQKLNGRTPEFVINNEEIETKEEVTPKTEIEKLDVSQGKLVIGLDILENKKDSRYIASLYNTILGESPNSKMFQNVREKASLAYSARSIYVRQKNNIFIKCGIEIENYDKAVSIIKQQIEDMQKGNFTEEDILNAKKYIKNGIKTVEESQETQIIYYIGQELSGYNYNLQEYSEKIESVTKKDIVDIANKIKINTIYFLRN